MALESGSSGLFHGLPTLNRSFFRLEQEEEVDGGLGPRGSL